MRRSAHVTMALGNIDGKLANALADQDTAGITAGIQQLAGIAELIRDNGYRVPQVMANFGRGVTFLRQRASVAELDDAQAACGQAADGAASPLVTAAFLAAQGNLLAAKADQTGQLPDLDRAVVAFEQAIQTLPDMNPAMTVYRQRLAELRQGRETLAATDREAPATRPQVPAPAPAPPAGLPAAPPPPGPAHGADPAGSNRPPWTPETPEQAEAFAALAEPMTGDVIPVAVRRSPKFIWTQRGLLVLSLACSANLAYAWLHGGTFLGTGDAILATIGFWLTYIAARFGLVYKRPG